MVFALLYGLGMRVGEVARLKLGDADLICDTLFIRDTKFSKSRIVPMGPKLAERLKCYIEKCHGSAKGPDMPLFSFTKRGCIHEGTISRYVPPSRPKAESSYSTGRIVAQGARPPPACRFSDHADLVLQAIAGGARDALGIGIIRGPPGRPKACH